MLNEFSSALDDYLTELEQNFHILLTENEHLRLLNNKNKQLHQLNNTLQTQTEQLQNLLNNKK